MREMKDSEYDWLGMIPKTWSLKRGRFLFSQRNEKGNSINLELLSPSQKFGVIPQRLLEAWTTHKAVKLKENTDLSELKTVHKGDFCISLRSFQGGFEYSEYEGVVSPAYQIFHKNIDLIEGYYRYLFKDSSFIDKMSSYTMSLRDGKNIAFFDFGNTYLPFPPLSEQQRIASYLDTKCSKIDDIIEKQQSVIEKLKAYKLSKLDELFNNFDGNNCHLGWICSLKNGLNFSFSDNGLKLKFLGVGDFKDYFVLSDKDMFSSIEVEDCIDKDYYLSNEDIVFVRSNGSKDLVGRAIMVDNINYPLVYSGFCIRLRNNRKDILDSKYLLYFFRSPNFRCQLAKFSQGSNINNINQYMLSHIDLKIPSLEYQKNIIEKLDALNKAIDSTIANKQALIEKLTAYKKSLIYEVVTGKKEV